MTEGDALAAPWSGSRLRLFVAVELPSAWLHALGQQSQRLENGAPGFGRWVTPELMHITLVFLGQQLEAEVPTIVSAMETAASSIAPFEIRPGALGCFGGARAVRVVWAGVEAHPPPAVGRLHASLATSLSDQGIAFDQAAFRPHITLARARRGAAAAQSELMHRTLDHRHWQPAPDPFRCDAITLVRSELRPSGPIYTPLHRQALGS